MAAYIVKAIDAGRCLQLGCPVGDGPRSGRAIPYRAIFVKDGKDSRDLGSSFIFTSWDRTEEHVQDEWQRKRLAKYASLEVKLDRRTPDGMTRLRTKRWANGLCFFDREEMCEFVFPWPESLFKRSYYK